MYGKRLATALAAALGAAGCVAPPAAMLGEQVEEEVDTVGDLEWLAGTWTTRPEGSVRTESWSPPRDGVMTGEGRVERDGEVVFTESLRLEERPDGIWYVAQPGDEGPTEFRLTVGIWGRLVFENPAHDFPQEIVYERNDEGGMHVAVRGHRQGELQSRWWAFRRDWGAAAVQ